MKNINTFNSIAKASRRVLIPTLGLAVLLSANVSQAAENYSGWSMNFTPVLIPKKDGYRFGGGVDPEVKYTLDQGSARLSAGLRVGGYYARNLFGVVAMPTLRLTIPVGPVEPYVAFGMGQGWIPKNGDEGIATMSRLGVVFRLSKSLAIGVEGTVQKIEDTNFRFPSLGSMISFDL